jgi:hypothetical protein
MTPALMSCPRIENCPLFSTFKVRASLGIWAVYYCESRYETCARYSMFKSGVHVPKNMLPNGELLGGGHLGE